jgi:hypothetical protein
MSHLLSHFQFVKRVVKYQYTVTCVRMFQTQKSLGIPHFHRKSGQAVTDGVKRRSTSTFLSMFRSNLETNFRLSVRVLELQTSLHTFIMSWAVAEGARYT